MSGYRDTKDALSAMAGAGQRMVRSLISARQLVTDSYEAVERVLVRGRESRDTQAGADGQHDELHAENCQPVGLVARPASNATVEAVVANIGASGTNPYLIATIDGTRSLVIDARTIGADVTILYNSTDVVEIRDGKIRAGSLGGTTAPIPTQADFDNLQEWVESQFDGVNGHKHVVAGLATTTITTVPSTPTAAPVPSTPPAPNFTQRFETE